MNDYSITEKVISDISCKLANDIPLTDYEKERVIFALNRVRDVKQIPYYEVVYHDEYDRTEHRIMNPVSVRFQDDGHIRVRKDKFELDFNRMLP